MGVLSRTKREAREAVLRGVQSAPRAGIGLNPAPELKISKQSGDPFSTKVIQLVARANGRLDGIDTSMFQVDWTTIIPRGRWYNGTHDVEK